MHIIQNKSDLRLAIAIEQIDALLAQAIYVEKVNQKISIYGQKNSSELLVGREVMGREENLYGHDHVKVQDFSVGNEVKQTIAYENFQSLIDQATTYMNSNGKSWFRIQIDLDDFQSAQVSIFDNLEKYMGPACA